MQVRRNILVVLALRAGEKLTLLAVRDTLYTV